MPRHRQAPKDRNRVPATAVYAILGYQSVQAMDHSRRAMQQVMDLTTGAIIPAATAVGRVPGESPEARRRREVDLEQRNALVVPLWGGVKYPKGSWTYDLARCTALAEGGVDALIRASVDGQHALRDG